MVVIKASPVRAHPETVINRRNKFLPLPIELFLAKINSIATLSPADISALLETRLVTETVAAGTELASAGERSLRSFFVSEGFIALCKTTGSKKRQIVNLHVVGDMPDLQSLHSRHLDVSVKAITKAQISYVFHEDLIKLSHAHPGIGIALWRMCLVEAATARSWIVNLGQREGASRTAHMFCELHVRLRAVGQVKYGACAMPIPQVTLAEAVGMTSVHFNRILQDLRRADLLQFNRQRLTILDWDRLAQLAEFDPLYLQLK